MLHLVRRELKSEIRSSRSHSDSRFNTLESRFKDIDGRFNDVDARFKKIDARFNEVDARFDKVDARFKEIDARFDRVDARFAQVDARFDQVMGAIHQLTSEVARIGTLVEEQNSRNQIVLEALTGLYQRQDRVESRMDRNEELFHSIATRPKG